MYMYACIVFQNMIGGFTIIQISLGPYVLHNARDTPLKVDCFNYMIDKNITLDTAFDLGVSRGCLMAVSQTYSEENKEGYQKCACKSFETKQGVVKKPDTTIIDSSSTTTITTTNLATNPATKTSTNPATNPATKSSTNPATNPVKNPAPNTVTTPSPVDNQASSHFTMIDSMLTYVMILIPLLM